MLRVRPPYDRLETSQQVAVRDEQNMGLTEDGRPGNLASFDTILQSHYGISRSSGYRPTLPVHKYQEVPCDTDKPLPQAPRRGVFRWTGWYMGAIASTLTAFAVLCINIGLTVWVLKNGQWQGNDGVGTLFQGSCKKVKDADRYLHLVINMLSTVLLACSNYCMQVLSSPTREEVIRAHAMRYWLHIGVPNISNLFRIGKDRSILWLLLCLSSVPLHLLFNSVVFANLQANLYSGSPVTPFLLNGGGLNQSNFLGANVTMPNPILEPPGSTSLQVIDDSLRQFIIRHNQRSRVENITALDCMRAYGDQYVSTYGDVLMVQDEIVWHSPYSWQLQKNSSASDTDVYAWVKTSNAEDDEIFPVLTGDDDGVFPFASDPAMYPSNSWRCATGGFGNCELTHTLLAASADPSGSWAPFGAPVKYCLVEAVEEQCKLQFSLAIALTVLLCNLIKTVCMAIVFLRYRRVTFLVTLGDAIASFLDHPDPQTEGRCLYTRTSFINECRWESHGHVRRAKPEMFEMRHKRWGSACSKMRWASTYVLYITAIIVASSLIKNSLMGMPRDVKSLWAIGFGTLKGNNLLSIGTSLLGGVVLANAPQALLSYLYVCFNAIITSMLVSHEWAKFFSERKALRVTSPTGQQRSTYWLQVPFRYALPLAALSALLHWLASQSIFMVQISVLLQDELRTVNREESISTCGYSPFAIILTTVTGSIIALVGILLALRRYPAGIPLAASCSAAISAACHLSPDERKNGSVSAKPLQWGATGHEAVMGRDDDDSVGHCSFSSEAVATPIVGKLYA